MKMTVDEQQSEYIHGVGNEVVLFVTAVIVIALTSIWILTKLLWVADDPVTAPRIPSRVRHHPVDCPICLGPASLAVETNCGHVYCHTCIMQLHQHDSRLFRPPNCPYCRQRITMLIALFSQEEEESTDQNEAERREVVRRHIIEFNRLYSNLPRGFMEQIRDIPAFLRHLYRSLLHEEDRIEVLMRVRLVVLSLLFLAYFVLPIDLLPEAVLGPVGFIDDVIVFVVIVNLIQLWYRQSLAP